jgi:hypothetical protein
MPIIEFGSLHNYLLLGNGLAALYSRPDLLSGKKALTVIT